MEIQEMIEFLNANRKCFRMTEVARLGGMNPLRLKGILNGEIEPLIYDVGNIRKALEALSFSPLERDVRKIKSNWQAIKLLWRELRK